MSNQTTFPDAIVFPDGTIRLVTAAAKSWTYANTEIKCKCTASTVPDYVLSEDEVAQKMEDKGFVVMRERQPVFHYRSKRRTMPKSSNPSEDEYDGHRARFEGMTVEEYRKRIRTSKGIARWQSRNYRRMQERDEKRKALKDNPLDS